MWYLAEASTHCKARQSLFPEGEVLEGISYVRLEQPKPAVRAFKI